MPLSAPKERQKIWLIGGLGAVGLALVFATLIWGNRQASADQEAAELWRVRSLSVLLDSERLQLALDTAQRGQRGFLLTGNDAYLEPYEAGRRAARALEATLRAETAGDPVQTASLDRLDGLETSLLAELARTIDLFRQNRAADALALVRSNVGQHWMTAIGATLDSISAEERRLLGLRERKLQAAARRSALFNNLIIGLGATLLVLSATLGVVTARIYGVRARTERLLRLAARTARFAVRDLALNPSRADWTSAVHADDLDRVTSWWAGAVASGQSHCEIAFRHADPAEDGGPRYASIYGLIMRDPRSGRALRALGIIRDVTEQARAERALRESEARLNAILDTVPVGVSVCEAPSGRLVFGNPTIERMFGHPLKRSETVADYIEWEAYHADGRRVAAAEFPLAQVMASGQSAEGEYLFAREAGAPRWMRVLAAPITNGEGRMTGGVVAMIDTDDARRMAGQQTLLVGELSHRVKNALTVVQGLAVASLGSAADLPDFRVIFEGRLQALSMAHSMLLRTNWTGLSLLQLAKELLGPYQDGQSDRVRIEGPDFGLDARQGLPLTLVLHELATNAVKYGALSTPEGRLSLRWTVNPGVGEPTMLMVWEESGVRVSGDPVRSGFGTRLIRRSVESELCGTAERVFQDGRLCWRLNFPLSRVLPIAA